MTTTHSDIPAADRKFLDAQAAWDALGLYEKAERRNYYGPTTAFPTNLAEFDARRMMGDWCNLVGYEDVPGMNPVEEFRYFHFQVLQAVGLARRHSDQVAGLLHPAQCLFAALENEFARLGDNAVTRANRRKRAKATTPEPTAAEGQ